MLVRSSKVRALSATQDQVLETGFMHSDTGPLVMCGTSSFGHVHRGMSKVGGFIGVLVVLRILESLSDLYLCDCGRGSMEAFQASDGSPLFL